MTDLKIVVAAHKPYAMPDDPAYIPVQVGAVGKPPIADTHGRQFRRDDEGDGISAKNPGWCELTGIYWAWKNLKADAYGLVHYRRHFMGASGGIATGDEIRAMLDGALDGKSVDAILPRKRNYFIESTYSHYVHAHHAQDLDLTREILREIDPASIPHFDAAMKSTKGHRFNMFVMRKALFEDYCRWLFGILGKLEGRLDTSGYSQYDARVFGFVAERLLDVWLARREVKYAELPVLHLEGQNWPKKIASFLARKFIGKATDATALAFALSLAAVCSPTAARELSSADGKSPLIPAREWAMIRQIAVNYDLDNESTWLLAAIRRHENGRPGLEFGIGGPMNSGHPAHRYRDGFKSFYVQGSWAAGTVRNNYRGDMYAFGKRYCPGGWKKWAESVTRVVSRLKVENNFRLPGERPPKRHVNFP